MQVFHGNATGNYLLREGHGRLQSIIINKRGSGNNHIFIYDGTSASGILVADVEAHHQEMVLEYSYNYKAGLFVSCVDGTAADFSVVFW